MTRLCNSLPPRQWKQKGPSTPTTQRLPAITRHRFSLIRFRSPLLTESRLLSLPAGTEMFHFPAFPPNTLYIQVRVTGHISSRVSPFGNPRITARLPTPRGLSQAPTSFIGSWCQGIHRAPLQTCHRLQRCSRPLYSSQATGSPTPHTTPTHTPHRDPDSLTARMTPTPAHTHPAKKPGNTCTSTQKKKHHPKPTPAITTTASPGKAHSLRTQQHAHNPHPQHFSRSRPTTPQKKGQPDRTSQETPQTATE
jgi:hypothetical protein